MSREVVSVNYHYFREMPEGAVVLLGYLHCEAPKFDEWWPLPIEKVKSDIGMSFQRQTKYLNWLMKAGRIKYERRGLPSSRWVKLCSKTGE